MVTSAAKFGVAGLCDALRSELARDGVTLTTRLDRYTAAEGNKSQTSIYSFFFGDGGAPAAQDLGSTLVPGRKYRFTFAGVGNVFSAAIYDLEDLTYPLVSMRGDDTGGPSTFPASGYSGIFNISYHNPTSPVDTTFDNFVASETPHDDATSVSCMPATKRSAKAMR